MATCLITMTGTWLTDRYQTHAERLAALRDANQSVELLGVVVEDFINTATARVYERAKASRHGDREGT